MFVEVEAWDECELVSESDRKNSGGTVGMVDAGHQEAWTVLGRLAEITSAR